QEGVEDVEFGGADDAGELDAGAIAGGAAADLAGDCGVAAHGGYLTVSRVPIWRVFRRMECPRLEAIVPVMEWFATAPVGAAIAASSSRGCWYGHGHHAPSRDTP